MYAMASKIEPAQIFQKGIAFHKAGRLAEARNLYLEVLNSDPKHPDAHHNLGAIAIQSGQPRSALSYFKQALEIKPSQGQYWISYIKALIDTGNTEAARKVLVQGRAIGLKGHAVDELSAALDGQPVALSPETDTASPSIPGGVKTRASRAKPGKKHKKKKSKGPTADQVNQFVKLFHSGRYDQAEQFARTLIAEFPKHAFGWKALGGILVQLGRNQEGLEPLRKAVEIDPSDFDAHNNLGIALNRLGKNKEAETSYQRALKIKPDLAQIHNNLGTTLFDAGRKQEALTCYQRAVKLNPEFADAYANLGNTHYALQNLEQAKEAYEQSLQRKPFGTKPF